MASLNITKNNSVHLIRNITINTRTQYNRNIAWVPAQKDYIVLAGMAGMYRKYPVASEANERSAIAVNPV